MSSATFTVPQIATIAGCSAWSVYERVRLGDFPVPHLRVGRKILFPRFRVEEVFGPIAEVADGPA